MDEKLVWLNKQIDNLIADMEADIRDIRAEIANLEAEANNLTTAIADLKAQKSIISGLDKDQKLR